LVPRLNNRTDKAIDYKLGNVSAALIELGLAPVPGYAPYGKSPTSTREIFSRVLDLR